MIHVERKQKVVTDTLSRVSKAEQLDYLRLCSLSGTLGILHVVCCMLYVLYCILYVNVLPDYWCAVYQLASEY